MTSRQTRRTKWWVGGGALLALVALVVFVALEVSDRRRDPELPVAEWNRVLAAFSRRATDPGAPADGAAPQAPPVDRGPRTRRAWPPLDTDLLEKQQADYAALRPKSVIELQPFRRTGVMDLSSDAGPHGTATLINLNPTVNVSYLLTLEWHSPDDTLHYHLTNNEPTRQDLALDPTFADGLTIVDAHGNTPCDLWSSRSPMPIATAASVDAPYVGVCDGAVTLRLQTAGRKTALERTTDFLRTYVWGGEALTVFVRKTAFEDAFLDTAAQIPESDATRTRAGAPRPALVDPLREGFGLASGQLGIQAEGDHDGTLAVGQWYGAVGNPGIFVSVLQPGLVAPDILESFPQWVGALDEVEASALSYLVAFDLGRLEIGFARGTDHPRVDWSDRIPTELRDASVPGPDGIGTIAPLVSTGILGPAVAGRLAATFAGGFKRAHGAFKFGELSRVNHGSHYGFVEDGVVLSKLQPGLSTLLVLDDNTVDITTWTKDDQARLEHVKFARQNGVPLMAFDPSLQTGVPGALVSRWGPGNWSGSQDGRLRSLRAGVCIQDHADTRFLIYGYFSSATPSAMVRVFQAYGCRDAMHLDMNALEHTYAATYRVQDATLIVEHLIKGMDVLDQVVDDVTLPRFLGYADNRDFFYMLWREPSEEG